MARGGKPAAWARVGENIISAMLLALPLRPRRQGRGCCFLFGSMLLLWGVLRAVVVAKVLW